MDTTEYVFSGDLKVGINDCHFVFWIKIRMIGVQYQTEIETCGLIKELLAKKGSAIARLCGAIG